MGLSLIDTVSMQDTCFAKSSKDSKKERKKLMDM
jgi:hypothetical protein